MYKFIPSFLFGSTVNDPCCKILIMAFLPALYLEGELKNISGLNAGSERASMEQKPALSFGSFLISEFSLQRFQR